MTYSKDKILKDFNSQPDGILEKELNESDARLNNIKSATNDLTNSAIDWGNPDYTGARATEYVAKYTNRPEDAGTLESLQNILGIVGMIPGVGEPADWANAAIYGSQGDVANAALYGSGIGMMGNIIGKNKKIIEYAAKKFSELGLDTIGEASKYLDKFRKFEKSVDATPGIKDATPLKYIDRFAQWYRKNAPEISPLQKKLNDLRDNPNLIDNLRRVMKDNVERHKPRK